MIDLRHSELSLLFTVPLLYHTGQSENCNTKIQNKSPFYFPTCAFLHVNTYKLNILIQTNQILFHVNNISFLTIIYIQPWNYILTTLPLWRLQHELLWMNTNTGELIQLASSLLTGSELYTRDSLSRENPFQNKTHFKIKACTNLGHRGNTLPAWPPWGHQLITTWTKQVSEHHF